MKFLLTSVLILTALYAFVLLLAFLFSDKLMFAPPPRTYVKTTEHSTFDYGGKTQLTSIFLKAENPQGNIFYCHGNGEDLGMIYPFLDALRKFGYNVFSYDYAGYGYSDEKPTEQKLYKSAESAWKYASQKYGFTPENTFLMGFSLGSAVAFHTSTLAENWRGVIIAGGIAKGSLTILPINIIPWKILDNVSKVAKLKSPLLLLHGTEDSIVAPHNAKINFYSANCKKKLVMFEGFNHNDVFSSPKFWEEVKKFLTTQ